MESTMQKIYYDPAHSGGFRSVAEFYNEQFQQPMDFSLV